MSAVFVYTEQIVPKSTCDTLPCLDTCTDKHIQSSHKSKIFQHTSIFIAYVLVIYVLHCKAFDRRWTANPGILWEVWESKGGEDTLRLSCILPETYKYTYWPFIFFFLSYRMQILPLLKNYFVNLILIQFSIAARLSYGDKT